MIEKFCTECNEKYQVKNYRQNKTRFCSRRCSGKWHYKNTKNNFTSNRSHLIGNKFRQGKMPANAF